MYLKQFIAEETCVTPLTNLSNYNFLILIGYVKKDLFNCFDLILSDRDTCDDDRNALYFVEYK